MDRDASSELRGADAVVDKDLSVDADVLLMLTGIETVQDGYGTAAARPIRAEPRTAADRGTE